MPAHPNARFSEVALAKFPAGTPLDTFLGQFHLEGAHLDAQPSQAPGHIQGWYRLPEGDLMISATSDDNGLMRLDQTPWILPKQKKD